MRILIFLTFILLSSGRVFGLSHFEEYFNQNDLSIPHPFTKFAKSIQETSDNFRGIIHGHSRALDRKLITDTRPKFLLAYGDAFSFHTFVGHVKDDGEMEVISWNKKNNEYDFIVVRDYLQNKKAKLDFSQKKTCLECHQNKGLIFARAPWLESVDNNFIRDKYERNGVSLELNTVLAEDYDDAVTQGNYKLDQQVFCKNICKQSDRQCLIDLKLVANGSKEATQRLLLKKIVNKFSPASISDYDPQFDHSIVAMNGDEFSISNYLFSLDIIEDVVTNELIRNITGFSGDHPGNPFFKREIKIDYTFGQKMLFLKNASSCF